MIAKLLTEHHLEFLCLKRGCTGLYVSTHVKMPHCWKSHITAQVPNVCFVYQLSKMEKEYEEVQMKNSQLQMKNKSLKSELEEAEQQMDESEVSIV